MEQNEIQQQIALYYSKLPAEAQEMFSKMEWLSNLDILSGKYALGEEGKQTLGTETTLVLLGIIHLDEYEEKVRHELGLSLEQAEKLLVEVNEQILKSIRPQLSQAFEANARELEAEQKNREAPKETLVEEKLDARFDRLPETTKKIIIESGYHDKLYAVSTANKLSIPQMGALEEAVTATILGTSPATSFEESIKNEVGVSAEAASKLALEINEKILKPIREKMVGAPAQPQETKQTASFPSKLAGTVQASTVKTDYSLQPEKKFDPYREKPE